MPLIMRSSRPSPTPTHTPTRIGSGTWEEVGPGSASGGGISSNNGYSSDPSLAMSPDGFPCVAWNDTSDGGTWQIYVLCWNGYSWGEIGSGSASGGGISNNDRTSYQPSLAFSPAGLPYVAWQDSDRDEEIYVRHWDGFAWREVGSGSASSGGISNNSGHSEHPSLGFDPDGAPYVTWYDQTSGDWQIYVRRFSGSAWDEVGAGSASGGGISNSSGFSDHPSLAIAPDGAPYIAWSDYTNGEYQIYIRRFNGTIWEEVGLGSASGGGISSSSGSSVGASLAFTPDRVPFVAWADYRSWDYEAYVRRWSGSSWEEVGSGSASGGGISNNSGDAWHPSLAIGPDGHPYVAWVDNSGGDYQVYVRGWSGSSWQEVGLGSASGRGISDSGGNASHPSLAFASDGIPYIAWRDYYSGNAEIYVRRYSN